jgi:hypothetical protein
MSSVVKSGGLTSKRQAAGIGYALPSNSPSAAAIWTELPSRELGRLCLFVILFALLRSRKAAIATCILLITVTLGIDYGFAYGLAFGALWYVALMRYGYVAAILTHFSHNLFAGISFTLQSSTWYAPYGYLALAIFAALIFYGFRFSIGKRPLLAPSRLDE